MPPILTATNLSKTFQIPIKQSGFVGGIRGIFNPQYRQFDAVKGLNLTINPGEKVAFLGPNGAGKSTSIKMFSGILTPSNGELSVCGLSPVRDRNQLAYQIGAVFGQVSKLYYHLTPIDTFKLFGRMYDIENSVLRTRLDWLIDSFEIGEFLHTPVRKLSLGQRMRAEVVASLIHSPKILFLDEPTIGLDMIAKSKLRDVINTINSVEGTTVLLTSHDIGDIEEVCERVVIIAHGGIVYDGTLKALKHDHVKSKSIILRFEEPTVLIPRSGIEIVSSDPYHAELRIPNTTKDLKNTLTHLLDTYSIEDLSVSEPDTETIIKSFYTTPWAK
jgi:ABC-2 type transport system ATP-binding protein